MTYIYVITIIIGLSQSGGPFVFKLFIIIIYIYAQNNKMTVVVVLKSHLHLQPPHPLSPFSPRYDLGTPAIVTLFLLQTDPGPHQRRENLCGPHRKKFGDP